MALHWTTIGLRLALTLLAGSLLGFDRSRNGHPAGLRTTLLVTLAASVAMIQMDLLLPTSGKAWNSFAVMDVMRLPLGILTGVGFIGAGAIIRRGDMVLGVTTAATLWFGTVVGLCIGGGQVILGCVAALLGYAVLTALRWLERRLEELQPAVLTLVTSGGSLTPAGLRQQLEAARFRVKTISIEHADQRLHIRCDVRWPSTQGAADLPPLLEQLCHTPGLVRLGWRSVSTTAK